MVTKRFVQTAISRKKSTGKENNEVIKAFDAFAGVGGFTLALEEFGVETVGFSEIDKYANMVLKNHWPDIPNYGDITKLNPKDLPDFDLFTFGSPCQDFSIAGKRAGIDGSRSGLFLNAIEVIEEKKPKYFIFENVKGMLSSNRGWDMARAFVEMAEAGYSLWWQVLNAKDFGVPQNRERVFVVGTRGERGREVLFESGNARQDFVKNPLKGKTDYGWHLEQNIYPEDSLCRSLKSTEGSGNKPKLIKLKEITQGVSDAQRIYNPDGLAKSQKALGGGLGAKTGLNEVGTRIRRLTPKECERLMSWPDDWTRFGINDKGEKVEMSDTQRYKMCGNGVVSDVVKYVFNESCSKP